MLVEFFTFAKKENSTKQPATASGTPFQCVIKNGSSVVSPTIELATESSPAAFNYARIALWNRLYYVRDWSYERGLWTASLEVDVLASFKEAIGASSRYVLRCSDSAAYDKSIIDTYYTAKGFCTTLNSIIDEHPWNTTGSIVLGIIGNGAAHDARGNVVKTASYGAVQYFAFTGDELNALFEYLFGSSHLSALTGGGITEEWVKVNYNPFQYIASAMWVPFDLTTPTRVVSIPCGWEEIPVAGRSIGSYVDTPTLSITIPKHPQAATRGSYLNLEPFTQYSLRFQPFGLFPLDSTQVGDATSLSMRVRCDLTTGVGRLHVETNGGAVVGDFEAQIGVPIQLSQIARDTVGAVTSTVGTVAGAIGSLLSGNIAGAITTAVNGVGDAMAASLPQMQTTGSNGSRTAFLPAETPRVVAKTYQIIDSNDEHAGVPCCKELRIDTLSGYLMCADGELELAATLSELDAISSYLTGGFFYE